MDLAVVKEKRGQEANVANAELFATRQRLNESTFPIFLKNLEAATKRYDLVASFNFRDGSFQCVAETYDNTFDENTIIAIPAFMSYQLINSDKPENCKIPTK